MVYNDETQRELIDYARMGSVEHRDVLLLYYYERIKKNLIKLKVPEQLQDDIRQDCIIELINRIYDYNFSNYSKINVPIHYIIFKQIAKSLDKVYDYKREINGIVYDKPNLYLYKLYGNHYTLHDVIREYLEYGKIKEDIIHEEVSSDRVVEEKAVEDSLVKEYWKYVNSENEIKQAIIMGRFPIDSCYEETLEDLKGITGRTRSYIHDEEKRIRSNMARYSKFYQHFKK